MECTKELHQLISTSFLVTHTKWNNVDEFERGLPIDLKESINQLRFIEDSALDKYIQTYSDFLSWNQFIIYLTEEHLVKELGYRLKDYNPRP